MRSETIYCLERAESALVHAHLVRTRQLRDDCRHYRPISHLPVVVRAPAPEWPGYTMDEIQSDMKKMLISELTPVYASALIGDDRLPEIRANYGTGILPPLFGCEIVEKVGWPEGGLMLYACPSPTFRWRTSRRSARAESRYGAPGA